MTASLCNLTGTSAVLLSIANMHVRSIGKLKPHISQLRDDFARSYAKIMMTSSNGNIFRVTDPLWGNSLITCEFLPQRPVTRSFGVLFDLHLNKRWVNNRDNRAHYDVTIMKSLSFSLTARSRRAFQWHHLWTETRSRNLRHRLDS